MRKLPAILVLLLLLTSCNRNNEMVQRERVVSVGVAVVTSSDQEIRTTFTGTLEGERQAVLYAKLAEAVEEVHVAEGDRVQADQVLISLDRHGPTSGYDQALSRYRNSEKNFEKTEFLYKEGAVSESQFDAAKTEYEVNKASFEAARRLVEMQTPIAGEVTSVDVSEGDLVIIGQRLATVAAADKLRMKFGVNARDYQDIAIGSPVYVTTEAVSDTIHGTVTAKANSADPNTRTFEVEGILDNPARRFKPGMFVRVGYLRERLEDRIVVPRKAVLMLDNVPTVYVVQGQQAKSRPVDLGPDIEGGVVVASGLSEGDTLVVLGQDYLEDGVKVNVTELGELAR